MVKKVLITGSTKGIGKAIAESLEEEGYEIFRAARHIEDTNNSKSSNLTNIQEAEKLFSYVKNNFGEIDILVNNAGEYLYSPIEKTEKNKIIELFNLNFLSHYYLTGLVVPDMKKKGFGRIVNISSISGIVGEANASLYAASKSAYYGFSKSLALELAQYNITVNSISPGWVDTDLTNSALSNSEKEEALEIIPQKRFIKPDEIGNLVKYLIDEKAKGITGQNINMCAGLTCGC